MRQFERCRPWTRIQSLHRHQLQGQGDKLMIEAPPRIFARPHVVVQAFSEYWLQGELELRLGRRVDVLVLPETRLREKVEQEGERWTL